MTSAANFFALNIAARALLIAALGGLVFYLLATTQYYATSLVLAGLMALAIFDMARILTGLDAPVTRIMEALSARVHEVPLGSTEQFVPGMSAVGKTIALLQEERRENARQTAYLQSLADSVFTALIVIKPDGKIALANRAARMLAGEEVGCLADITAVGAGAARLMTNLALGARAIVRLADGRQMLASMAEFSVPGQSALRLLALQNIVGDLDAVELKAWRDMTRILAHEMMNSLTPISSLSESLADLLRADAKSADATDAVETITRRAQGLISFVERYRKIADLPEPVLHPVRLADFVRGIDTLMKPMLAQKHIAYSSTLSSPGLTLNADAELLNQAVINLLHNARDAVEGMENPAITLTCAAEKDRISIAVSDNGRGIPPDRLEDIFVPFFTTKTGGSGIGLSLARQIALAHHGRIEVQANIPRGTVFRLFLPAPGVMPG